MNSSSSSPLDGVDASRPCPREVGPPFEALVALYRDFCGAVTEVRNSALAAPGPAPSASSSSTAQDSVTAALSASASSHPPAVANDSIASDSSARDSPTALFGITLALQPTFFSSGAGSNAPSPTRLKVRASLGNFSNFLKTIHPTTGEVVPGAAETNFTHDAMRELSKKLLLWRGSEHFPRVYAAMQRFCAQAAELLDDDLTMMSSRSKLAFFACGAGSCAQQPLDQQEPGSPPVLLGVATDSFPSSPILVVSTPPPQSAVLEPPPAADPAAMLKELLAADKLPHIDDAFRIIDDATTVLLREANVVTLSSPCVVVGDVHGQLADLRRIVAAGGPFGSTTYLFLGDYVDRGPASIHCILILALAKLLYPDRVFLLRGNHETKQINGVYGFLTECERKYPAVASTKPMRASISGFGGFDASTVATHPLWASFNEMFKALPLAAIIDNSIFCVHGGLSPGADYVESILCINRLSEICGGPLADLTWSDPAQIKGFQHNWRGSGCQFGAEVTLRFLRRNGLRFVCRAHQCVRDGFQWGHNNRLVTVFSATDYCGLGNCAAIMRVEPTSRGAPMSPREPPQPRSLENSDSCIFSVTSPIATVGGGDVPEATEPFEGVSFEVFSVFCEPAATVPSPSTAADAEETSKETAVAAPADTPAPPSATNGDVDGPAKDDLCDAEVQRINSAAAAAPDPAQLPQCFHQQA